LALATEHLKGAQLNGVGLSTQQTVLYRGHALSLGPLSLRNQVIFGSGLVHLEHWSELLNLNIASGEAAGTDEAAGVASCVPCIPRSKNVQFTNRWGGPILIADEMTPVFQASSKKQKHNCPRRV